MATAAPGSRLDRSRRPERTLLDRALADPFAQALGVYEERFEPTHGDLRRSVAPAVYRYLDCGVFAHGAARAHCAECGHDALIAFSCKLRCLCPPCHQKRELLWVEWASELLAEVPHRQVVFTVPKRLRIFFRFDRKLLGELPGCAWRALRLYFAVWFGGEEVGEVVVPGAIGFLQTSGELLGWHPHLHVLLTDGGWLPDGTFRHLLAFDSSQVEKLFRAEVLRLLVARRKISGEVVDNLLTWRHSGFSVHAAVRVQDRQDAARLGRYGIRCPLVLERLAWDEVTAEIVYSARPAHRDGAGASVARWNVLDFLARVLFTSRTPASSSCATGAGTATPPAAGARARRAPRPPRAPIRATKPRAAVSPGRSSSARSTRSIRCCAPSAAPRCASSPSSSSAPLCVASSSTSTATASSLSLSLTRRPPRLSSSWSPPDQGPAPRRDRVAKARVCAQGPPLWYSRGWESNKRQRNVTLDYRLGGPP